MELDSTAAAEPLLQEHDQTTPDSALDYVDAVSGGKGRQWTRMSDEGIALAIAVEEANSDDPSLWLSTEDEVRRDDIKHLEVAGLFLKILAVLGLQWKSFFTPLAPVILNILIVIRFVATVWLLVEAKTRVESFYFLLWACYTLVAWFTHVMCLRYISAEQLAIHLRHLPYPERPPFYRWFTRTASILVVCMVVPVFFAVFNEIRGTYTSLQVHIKVLFVFTDFFIFNPILVGVLYFALRVEVVRLCLNHLLEQPKKLATTFGMFLRLHKRCAELAEEVSLDFRFFVILSAFSFFIGPLFSAIMYYRGITAPSALTLASEVFACAGVFALLWIASSLTQAFVDFRDAVVKRYVTHFSRLLRYPRLGWTPANFTALQMYFTVSPGGFRVYGVLITRQQIVQICYFLGYALAILVIDRTQG